MSILQKMLEAKRAEQAALKAQPTAQPVAQVAQAIQAAAQPTQAPTASPAPKSALAAMLEKQRQAQQAKHTGFLSGGGAATTGNVSSTIKFDTTETPLAATSKVLTSHSATVQSAQALVTKRAQEGFYNIQSPESLPADLPAEKVTQLLIDLDSALLGKTPELPALCVQINKNLRQFEELAYLLTDEQLHLIVSAELNSADVMISSGKAVDKSTTAKLSSKLADVSADDFF